MAAAVMANMVFIGRHYPCGKWNTHHFPSRLRLGDLMDRTSDLYHNKGPLHVTLCHLWPQAMTPIQGGGFLLGLGWSFPLHQSLGLVDINTCCLGSQ
jgi:hypothetical protein